MLKMVTQAKAPSFEISKLKNFRIKTSNPPEVTGIGNPSKSRAQRHQSFKRGSKLKYLD